MWTRSPLSKHTSPKWRAHSRFTRWLAALLLMVASPCATELALSSIASAFADDVARDTCCAERHVPDSEAPDASPDARRAACGCCHSFEPTTFSPPLVTRLRSTVAVAADQVLGEPVDGHAQPPFRPPTRA